MRWEQREAISEAAQRKEGLTASPQPPLHTGSVQPPVHSTVHRRQLCLCSASLPPLLPSRKQNFRLHWDMTSSVTVFIN